MVISPTRMFQLPLALYRLSEVTDIYCCAGSEGQGFQPSLASSYSGKRRSSNAINDQSASSFPGIFEFPEGNHGT